MIQKRIFEIGLSKLVRLAEAYILALVRTISRLRRPLQAALPKSLQRLVFSSMCNDLAVAVH